MNNVSVIVHKVRQAPWRVQLQWIGLFLLSLVLMAMVAGIYLNVTVRATLAGREVQSLQADITTNKRLNADMETNLAGLTSVEAMQPRAEALGFEPASLEDITYIVVPGYAGEMPVDLSLTKQVEPVVPTILPAYRESWLDYFLNQKSPSSSSGATQ